jgi:hypothetical protein
MGQNISTQDEEGEADVENETDGKRSKPEAAKIYAENVRAAIELYFDDPASAEDRYGPFKEWKIAEEMDSDGSKRPVKGALTGLVSEEANLKFVQIFAEISKSVQHNNPFPTVNVIGRELIKLESLILIGLTVMLFVSTNLQSVEFNQFAGAIFLLMSFIVSVSVGVWEKYLSHYEMIRILHQTMRNALKRIEILKMPGVEQPPEGGLIHVLRDGNWIMLPVNLLVVGDLIQVKEKQRELLHIWKEQKIIGNAIRDQDSHGHVYRVLKAPVERMAQRLLSRTLYNHSGDASSKSASSASSSNSYRSSRDCCGWLSLERLAGLSRLCAADPAADPASCPLNALPSSRGDPPTPGRISGHGDHEPLISEHESSPLPSPELKSKERDEASSSSSSSDEDDDSDEDLKEDGRHGDNCVNEPPVVFAQPGGSERPPMNRTLVLLRLGLAWRLRACAFVVALALPFGVGKLLLSDPAQQPQAALLLEQLVVLALPLAPVTTAVWLFVLDALGNALLLEVKRHASFRGLDACLSVWL